MLVWCWSTVFDADPASNQHWSNGSCLLVIQKGDAHLPSCQVVSPTSRGSLVADFRASVNNERSRHAEKSGRQRGTLLVLLFFIHVFYWGTRKTPHFPLTPVLLLPDIYGFMQIINQIMSLKMDNIVCGRCSVRKITTFRGCILSKNINIFRHSKLEIALAIPASNDEKYNWNNSAWQELNTAHWLSVGLKLGWRYRRRTNHESILGQRLVFAGISHCVLYVSWRVPTNTKIGPAEV